MNPLYRVTYWHPLPGPRARRFLTIRAASQEEAFEKLLALIPGASIIACGPGEERRYLPHKERRLKAREVPLPAGAWLVRDLRGQWERPKNRNTERREVSK